MDFLPTILQWLAIFSPSFSAPEKIVVDQRENMNVRWSKQRTITSKKKRTEKKKNGILAVGFFIKL